jgi:hypothetical protein
MDFRRLEDNIRGSGKCLARAMIIFTLFFLAIACAWAFEDAQNQKTISGTVEDIDWVRSIITVRYADLYSGNIDEINIVVPSEAKIMNGTETKYLSDLGQSDPVIVTYYDDGLSGLKAKSITDLNAGNRDL